MPRRERGFSDSQKYKILTDANVRVQCRACGEWRALAEIEFDHIVALVHKGSNDPTNGQCLCDPCHKKKLQRTLRLTQKLSESSGREKEHGGERDDN